jgi:hypothetical protein
VCWSVIKHDLIAVFDDFYDHKIDLDRINYGISALVPKVDEADTIKNN